MIVLAIAGLIMLIVFLAVPALQRASRNTDRKNDIGRISSAINDYVSNNNGSLPPTGSWATLLTGGYALIMADAGTLSYYNGTNLPAGASVADGTLGAFDVDTGAQGPMPTMMGDAMLLDEGGVCPTTPASSASPTTVAGSARQAALLYTVEPNNGNWLWDCIQAE